MTKTKKVTKRRNGQSASKAMLGNEPPAYMDEEGRIIIVGFEPWNKASFVEKGRAIPDKWKALVVA